MEKFLDRFEEKQIREYEKLLKRMDRLHEENRDEIRKRMKNCETGIRQYRRDINKLCSIRISDDTEDEENSWYPPEI